MSNYDKDSEPQSYWNEEGGNKWVEHIEFVESMMVSINERLIAEIQAQKDESILDVGCGGGITSMKLAEQVGANGKITGLDVSEPILAVAQERGKKFNNLQFRQNDAATTDFSSESYDVLTSRFGVMFFDDPFKAFKNLREALKENGRMVFVCWKGLEDNPWLGQTSKAAFEIVPPVDTAKPDPTAPGPFSLGNPEHLTSILDSAGFSDIDLQSLELGMPLADVDAAVEFLSKMGPAAEVIKDASAEDTQKIQLAIRAVLESFRSNGEVRAPAACWLVTAKK